MRVPMMPPTRWTPTTSSESSRPNRYFRPTAQAQASPAIPPIARAPTVLTAPHDGVIATSPATMPEAAPRVVALPCRIRSITSQPSNAAMVATVVLTKVTPVSDMNCAVSFAPPSPAENTIDPTLKPYQPNQSSPAPIMVNVTLCGFIGSFLNPTRGPMMTASTRPATPALMCTTVPPA